MLKRKLILLPAMILLISLTACKTVYVVPTIQEPVLNEEPTHEPWHFIAIDENNYILSEHDLKVLTQYIIDLKTWGQDNYDWTQYYIDELERVKEMFNE